MERLDKAINDLKEMVAKERKIEKSGLLFDPDARSSHLLSLLIEINMAKHEMSLHTKK